jgi:thioredoxin 1
MLDKISLKELVNDNLAVMIYFFSPVCTACEALRPKVKKMATDTFKNLNYHEVDSSQHQSLTAEAGVYSAPTIIVFFDGKETIREGKYISVPELANKIDRYYNMIY